MVLQDLQVWRARLNSKVGKVRQEMDLLRDSMTTQVHGLRQELDDLQVCHKLENVWASHRYSLKKQYSACSTLPCNRELKLMCAW